MDDENIFFKTANDRGGGRTGGASFQGGKRDIRFLDAWGCCSSGFLLRFGGVMRWDHLRHASCDYYMQCYKRGNKKKLHRCLERRFMEHLPSGSGTPNIFRSFSSSLILEPRRETPFFRCMLSLRQASSAFRHSIIAGRELPRGDAASHGFPLGHLRRSS